MSKQISILKVQGLRSIESKEIMQGSTCPYKLNSEKFPTENERFEIKAQDHNIPKQGWKLKLNVYRLIILLSWPFI